MNLLKALDSNRNPAFYVIRCSKTSEKLDILTLSDKTDQPGLPACLSLWGEI